jgi:hypothetical protein
VLRRFALFEIAFPLSKRLLDSLKGDVLWFKHDTLKCKLTDFYIKSPQPTPPAQPLRKCSNCQRLN